jgi:uncharacterized protein (TIGR02596 family)
MKLEYIKKRCTYLSRPDNLLSGCLDRHIGFCFRLTKTDFRNGVRLRPSAAFSLVELLVVMVIIAILSFLVIGSIRGISNSTDMTRASEDVAGVVNLAAQRAAAFNRQTSIRFLARSPSTTPYVAYQLWEQTNSQDPTSWQPAFPIQRLPADIVIMGYSTSGGTSSTGTFSTLFSRSGITGTWTDNTGTMWNYAQAYFAPDGSLVASTGQTSIAIVATNTPAGVSGVVTGLPPNFAVVDIEPLHAITVIYRP